MSKVLPKALITLIESLGCLPGVGTRTAERYAYYLLKTDKNNSERIANSLFDLHSKVKTCPKTFAIIDADLEVSPLYSDPMRDKQLIAVVAEPFDIVALENTGSFLGTYFVLGGLISPIDGIGPETLRFDDLKKRINEDGVREVILATNASVEGETTALYLQQQLADTGVKLSRLARGIPIGLDLEYADQITLGRALEGRTIL
ncbi:recombination protein RecR [Candidatus Nomurabacteria bacterium]|jgi:recombination protein RecR|nr:recombination protein RecR [Candidatus Saccharibacteria bacterium]MCB9839764.1 recombination protein RecR [Candidatus Nomurabacteria bacterium]